MKQNRESLKKTYAYMVKKFRTKSPRIWNGERIVFPINGVGKSRQSHVKEWNGMNDEEWKESLILHTEINSKCIKDLTIMSETINSQKEFWG